MSNLKLPTMTYDNLHKILAKSKKSLVKVAYATEVMSTANGISVLQHGNVIAELTPDTLYIDNCGYDTTTTATRLRKILADNGIGYYVRIKQYAMRLYNGSHTEIDPEFRSATLTRLGTTWSLAYGKMNYAKDSGDLDLFAA